MSSTGPESDPYTRPAKPADDSTVAPPPNSGYAPSNMPGAPAGWPTAEPPKGMAIASLVLGICGVMFSWFIFGIPSILAVIFGHVALAKAKQGTGSGRELAIAGLIIGYVIIGLGLLVLVLSTLAYLSFSTV